MLHPENVAVQRNVIFRNNYENSDLLRRAKRPFKGIRDAEAGHPKARAREVECHAAGSAGCCAWGMQKAEL
jgi:hypothetical protein